MNRLLAILLFVPATVWAQAPVAPLAQLDAVPQAQGTSGTATPPDSGTHRRPSMVGYIGDSSISTKVRVRFDAGYGITAPDRAEFFYAKCGCYRTLPTNNAAYDPNAPGPGPGVVTNMNFGQLYLLGEYAPVRRFSAFVEVPFRFLRPDTFAPNTGSFGPANGLSDVHIGAKAGLISTEDRQLTLSLQGGFPTGDSMKGLGTNHGTVEPVLLYSETPSNRLAIEAQFGGIVPTSGSAGVPTSSPQDFSGSVLYYGVGPSYEAYRSSTFAFAPVVEVVGWHVLNGYQTAGSADASGINIVNIKVGARLMFRDRSSIYVGWGHAVTTATWYNNIVRVEYRVAAGN